MTNLAALAVIALSNPAAPARDATVVPGFVMQKPPVIDGHVDSEEWRGAPVFEGLVDGRDGGPAPKDMTARFRLAYDQRYVYFAAQCGDALPATIRATQTRTNAGVDGDDFVELVLDPVGNLTDFNLFDANGAGGTAINIAGGRAAKQEWLGAIKSAGRVTNTGWEVEMRIPWEIMRLPRPGVRDLRFDAGRYSPRLNRWFTFRCANNKPEAVPYWTSVNVPPMPPPKLLLLPYLSGVYDKDTGGAANIGFDARTPITPTLDFVGSVKPDFRNIQNSVLGLSFSYFEKLASESRPFFLEGSDYFAAYDQDIFVSQRIPRFDYGAKVTGRLQQSVDLGMFATDLPGAQQVFVTRLAKHFSVNENLSAMVATGSDRGAGNLATFAQYDRQWGRVGWYARASTTQADGNPQGRRLETQLSYNTPGTWTGLQYKDVSPNYNPVLGYAQESGFRGAFLFHSSSKNYSTGPIAYRHSWTDIELLGKYRGGWYRRSMDTFFSNTLRNPDVNIGFDSYFSEYLGNKDHTFSLNLSGPSGNRFNNVSCNFTDGFYSNQPYRYVEFDASRRLRKKLQVSGTWSQYRLGTTLATQLVATANMEVGKSSAIAARLLRNGKDISAYLAWQRMGLGADYFVVLGDPNSTKTRAALQLKVVWPLSAALRPARPPK